MRRGSAMQPKRSQASHLTQIKTAHLAAYSRGRGREGQTRVGSCYSAQWGERGGGNNTNMGQGTRNNSKSIQKVAATWPFFYSPRVRLFVFILFFRLSPRLAPSLSLSSFSCETYKQRRKFAIKAKVHIELECFAFYVA